LGTLENLGEHVGNMMGWEQSRNFMGTKEKSNIPPSPKEEKENLRSALYMEFSCS
jgi:hypothetical protein